jgi:serine/threonine protein kinase
MSTQPVKELYGLALDPRMPRVGDRVAHRYEVTDVLGSGGFAVVYRARDTRLGGEVALKVLEPDKSASPDFVTRFQQEINLVRQLRHHNTIKIWDAGLTERQCLYMASELVDGEELSSLIAREGGLELARVKRLTGQVLKSLAEAHKAGIVHRDLKPSNIMVAQLDGEPDYVKVVDFGIAKALTPDLSMVKTQTGMVMCTPAYASPEVLRNQSIGPASDLYALGLIMSELLTGQQAIQGQSQVDIIVRQIDPAPVALPPWLASSPVGAVIARAVAKSVEQRYGDALSMWRDLEAVPDGSLRRPPRGAGGLALPQASPAAFGPNPSAPLAWPPSTPVPTPASLPNTQRVAPPSAPSSRQSASAQTMVSQGHEPLGATTSPTSSKLPWILALVALMAAGALAFALLSREQGPASGPSVSAGEQGGVAEPRAQEPGVERPTREPSVPPAEDEQGGQTVAVFVPQPPEPALPVAPLPPTDPNAVLIGPPDTPDPAPPYPNVGTTVFPGVIQPPLAPLEPSPVAVPPVALPLVAPPQSTTPMMFGALGLPVPTAQPSEPEPTTPEPTTPEPTTPEPTTSEPVAVAPTPEPVTPEPVAPQVPPQAAGPVTYRITGSPERVRLTWRFADEAAADWSESIRCNRPCTVDVPSARPIEVRVRKDGYCSETFTLSPQPGHGPWELALREGCSAPTAVPDRNVICYNTCQWAHDGECDDGGPGSLYAVCTFGTDCADCGPRRLGR